MSPVAAPKPRAAAMLSPVPGATEIPVVVFPIISFGEATLGSCTSFPKASFNKSFLYSLVCGDQ